MVLPTQLSASFWGQLMSDVRVLSADDPESIMAAASLLSAGRVIAFPTDTVYGLGAHGFVSRAVEELYALKGRHRQKAIPLLIGDIADLTSVAASVSESAWCLAERFWPGPLTLVLPRAQGLLDVLTAGGPSIAVRLPAHAQALRLIKTVGVALAVTSANLSGQKEAVTAEEVAEAFGDRVPLILDGGRCPGETPSTVVDVTVSPARIRRRGAP